MWTGIGSTSHHLGKERQEAQALLIWKWEITIWLREHAYKARVYINTATHLHTVPSMSETSVKQWQRPTCKRIPVLHSHVHHGLSPVCYWCNDITGHLFCSGPFNHCQVLSHFTLKLFACGSSFTSTVGCKYLFLYNSGSQPVSYDPLGGPTTLSWGSLRPSENAGIYITVHKSGNITVRKWQQK